MDKKFRKKKQREREVRKKILARRTRIRAEAKEKRLMDAEERANRSRPIDYHALIRDMKERIETLDLNIAEETEENRLNLLKQLRDDYIAELNALQEMQCSPPKNEEETSTSGMSVMEKALFSLQRNLGK
jgi:hypothetical protein